MLVTGIIAQGGNLANATKLDKTPGFYYVGTSTNATFGVLLPSYTPKGKEILILNNSAFDMKVYPPYAFKIDGGTANAAVTVVANTSTRFIPDGAGNFWTF